MTFRNNQERFLGNVVQSSSDEEAVLNSKNLDFVMPTDYVTLPSEGKFYPKDNPLYGKDSIEIRFMSAKHEDILTNKSLLRKGLAIDRLLQSLMIDQTIKVDDFLTGDKNALIIAARISGYGEDYTTKVTCPLCEVKFEHIFNLLEIKNKEVNKDMIGDNGIISLTLPRTKAFVECKLLSGKDEKLLAQLIESKKKHKLPDALLTDQLKVILVSINGQADKDYMNKFIDMMPAADSRYLRVEYFKRVPDVNMNFDITCPECDNEQEVNMPLGAEFFWPQR